MAGGLFVFVRAAPPGGCALAITAGQYRPPMAHGPLSGTLEGPFLFCAARRFHESRRRSRESRCSDGFSMLFVFLCLHGRSAGNRAVMRTCNICNLNIPTWHIDKKSIKISKMYTPGTRSNCSLEL